MSRGLTGPKFGLLLRAYVITGLLMLISIMGGGTSATAAILVERPKDLPDASSLNDSDFLVIDQGAAGVKRLQIAQIRAEMQGGVFSQGLFSGLQAPETRQVGSPGYLYLQDNGINPELWIKRQGVNTSTGWLLARDVLQLSTPINVQASPYRAYGDGVHDDTAALQAAINDGGNQGGAAVYIPQGAYWTTGTLKCAARNVIYGAGRDSTVMYYTGNGVALLLGSADTNNPNNLVENIGLRDLTVKGTTNGLAGIEINGAIRFNLQGVKSKEFVNGYGLWCMENCYLGPIMDCYMWSNKYGIYATKTAAGTQSFNAVDVEGGEYQANDVGIVIGDPYVSEPVPIVGQGFTINAWVEGNKSAGVWVNNAYSGKIGGYFEGNGQASIRIGSTNGSTSVPVGISIDRAFMFENVCGVDLIRGQQTKIDTAMVQGTGATIGYRIGTSADSALLENVYWNSGNVATGIVDGGTSTVVRNSLADTHSRSWQQHWGPGLNIYAVDSFRLGTTNWWQMGSYMAADPAGYFKWYETNWIYRPNTGVLRANTEWDVEGDEVVRINDAAQLILGRVGPGNSAGIGFGPSANAAANSLYLKNDGTGFAIATNLQVLANLSAKTVDFSTFHAGPTNNWYQASPSGRAYTVYYGGSPGDYGAIGFQYSVGSAGAGSEIRNYNPSGGSDGDLVLAPMNSSGVVSNRFTVKGSNGRVGVGVSSPTEALDVSGAVKASSYVALTTHTTAPTAGALGAGGAALWVSNAVVYVSYTADGASLTTKQIAP